MKKTSNVWQQGQGLVEYALILVLASLIAIITLVALGPKISDIFNQIVNWSENEEENPGYVVVRVLDLENEGIERVRVYAVNDRGHYIRRGETDTNGEVAFEELDEGTYSFRADHQGQQLWSESINWDGEWLAVIETGQRPFTINVVDFANDGIEGVYIYSYTAEERWIGVHGRADDDGELVVDLIDGSYKFRAYYRGHEYWSVATTTPEQDNAIIETGERPFTVTAIDAAGNNIENARIYIYGFTVEDGYTGIGGRADENGQLVVPVPDGNFKFRADYQSHRYWSNTVETPADSTTIIETGLRPFSVKVIDADGNGLDNVRVYNFADGDRYTGVQGNTDENGIVLLDVPNGNFNFRADYRANQYWSPTVETPNQETVVIQTNEQELSVAVVDNLNNGISGVRIHAFTDDDHYAGIRGDTDENGMVLLEVPEGNFKFRADYRAHQYWSSVIETPRQETAVIPINEQEIYITVSDGNNNGISNARIYAFNENEDYAGVYDRTEESGTLVLTLPNGNFKFRADYRGNQYWSDTIEVPSQNTVSIQINEQEASITVVNGNGNGISNVIVYVFTDDDRYADIYGRTDTDGNLSLPLPEGIYKFRADYRGYQYWSNTVSHPNNNTTTLEFEESLSTVRTINETGQTMGNIMVYAYAENGSFTGVYGRTDSTSGEIDLALPTGRQYSFRTYYQNQSFSSATITSPGNATITIDN